jgi:hypothetical protein
VSWVRVIVSDGTWPLALEALAHVPMIRSLTLLVQSARALEGLAEGLAKCPHLDQLRRLEAWCADGGFSGFVGKLVANPYLGHLTELALGGSPIAREAMSALAASPHLLGLRSLTLMNCGLTVSSIGPLCSAPAPLNRLSELSLRQNPLGTNGVERLAEAPILAGLSDLVLSKTDSAPIAVMRLAASRHVKNLNHLDLSDNYVASSGVDALVASPHLKGLAWLALNNASIPIGRFNALVVARLERLPNLRRLDLAGNKVEPEAEALLHERWGERIRR